MKVIKNKSNNEQLKHCKYLNSGLWVDRLRFGHGKFELRANFEFNCGATARFLLGYTSEYLHRNLNVYETAYTHDMDCINNKYESWFRLFGRNLDKKYELNKTQKVRLKSHKNNYLNVIRYRFYFKVLLYFKNIFI
jgi:hypothetical protein